MDGKKLHENGRMDCLSVDGAIFGKLWEAAGVVGGETSQILGWIFYPELTWGNDDWNDPIWLWYIFFRLLVKNHQLYSCSSWTYLQIFQMELKTIWMTMDVFTNLCFILGGETSNIFYVHRGNWGRWTHFDINKHPIHCVCYGDVWVLC